MPRRDEAIEPGRLGRAITRKWDRIGPHQYIVEGRSEPFHVVNLESDTPCECRDAQYRGMLCLHTLRCLIIEQHPAVFEHVLRHYEAAIAAERERATAARRRTRRTTARAG